MIPGERISLAPVGRVTPVTATEVVGDARQQEFQRSLAGLVGKSMPAEILSKMSDGSFLVKVAGSAARMMLPFNAQPGAELPLTLVSLTPRPIFQLSNAPQSGAIAAYAASLLGEAALAAHQPPADAQASHATLSAAARVISSVLGAAAKSAQAQTSIVAPLPLLATAGAEPVQLAAALKDAIGASGLFYESHVAEWSAGNRPLAELSREPQMQRLVPAPAGTAESPVADPATAQFINLQLSSQEQGRVAWQGQLWPGQDMAWQISRDAPERGAGQDGAGEMAEAPWRSALRLRFPLLGEIGATVVLSGDLVHIELQAGSDQVGDLLRARAGELQNALEAAGSTLASLTVAAAGKHGHD